MAKRDKEFAAMAISLNYLTREQAAEGLRLLVKARQVGLNESLAEVLIKKGHLNRAQVEAVERALNQPRVSNIGKYRLIARIGQGGMGTVYKARQESLDKIVALKVLAPGLARQRDFVVRFIREAQASGRLNHRNVVLGFDAGEADGYYYFAMEFVDGESLKEILVRDGKLAARRALEITAAMASALEHAHQQNIVHRDIKPGNIFIAKDGTPKLGDLGLAKEIRTDKSITQAGVPVGTPYYISPEQVRGQEDIDQRADVYALGATLYRMVAGVVPFDGPTGAVVMTRHLNDPVPDPRKNTPDLPESVVTIIHHCMAKEAKHRYQNAGHLREDIEAALAAEPLPHADKARQAEEARARRAAQREAQAATRKRNLIIAGAAGGGLLVIALIVVIIAMAGREPAPKKHVAVVPKPATRTVRPRPAPKKRPRPRPSTATRPAPKANLAAVLKELVAFAADAEDHGDVERRFRDFILKHAGSKAVAEAKVRLAALKAQWQQEDDFRTTIQGHIRQHQYAQALAALDKPPFEKPSKKQEAIVDELRTAVEKATSAYVAAQTGKGEELIEKGDLAEATRLFQALGKLGLPDATQASQGALKKIADLAAARQQRIARGTFASLIVKAGPLVTAGKLDEAKALFDPAAAAQNPALAEMLKAGQTDVARIAAFFDEVAQALSSRKSARIRGIMRPVTKVEKGMIHCKIGGPFPIHELKTKDLEENKVVKSEVLLGLLELYRGESADAKTRLTALAGDPPDADVARWLQQIDWVAAIAREDDARKLLAQAKDLVAGGKWSDANRLITKLTGHYRDTVFVDKNRAAVSEVATQCAEALAAAMRKAETIKPFIDVSADCGDLTQAFKTYKPVGGWVMDINNDHMLDIALDIRRKAGESPLVPVFLNTTKPGADKITFRDATKDMGIDTGDEPICWTDLDGDGDLDIVCRGAGAIDARFKKADQAKLSLYENMAKGNPLFRSDTHPALSPDPKESPAAAGFGFGNIAVLDANGDGRADILAQFVGSIRTLTMFAARGKPFAFMDVSQRVGFVVRDNGKADTAEFLKATAWPQYVVFDADGDDRTDFIFNAENGILLCNRGRRGYARTASKSVAYQTYASGQTGNSPIVTPAVADYNNDGHIDIFVPQKGKNLLLRNDGNGSFVDAMHTTGPMATDAADSLWATWADVNNDGLLDLFICNSNERNRLYIQKRNNAFVDKAEEFGVTGEKSEVTNFVALGDFDRDGDIDMVILRENGRGQLLVNPYIEAENRFYVNVLVRAPVGAIGAKVYLIRPPDQIIGLQQIGRVEGYNRQTPREAFFGVGAPGEYAVRVVLSNRKELRKRVAINPTGRNILIMSK